MKQTLSVPEVHCEHCVSSIEGAVSTLAGVEEVKVDLGDKNVTVAFDDREVAIDEIIGAIEGQGYDVGDKAGLLQIGKRPD